MPCLTPTPPPPHTHTHTHAHARTACTSSHPPAGCPQTGQSHPGSQPAAAPAGRGKEGGQQCRCVVKECDKALIILRTQRPPSSPASLVRCGEAARSGVPPPARPLQQGMAATSSKIKLAKPAMSCAPRLLALLQGPASGPFSHHASRRPRADNHHTRTHTTATTATARMTTYQW
jgi:hypothetical protein